MSNVLEQALEALLLRRNSGVSATYEKIADDAVAALKAAIKRQGEPLYTTAPTMPDAHELWSAAQLANGEAIEDGVARIEAMLSVAPKGE